MAKPYFLETWLDYHFKIGIDKIYIFYDKKNSPDMDGYFNEIKNKYNNLYIYLSEESEINLIKQKLNFYKLKKILQNQNENIDFVFHIDDDELIYRDNENSLDMILNKYHENKMALHFNNYEALKTDKTMENYNYFKTEKYFKQRGSQLFNSYYNGKAGGFLSNIIWGGPHFLYTNDNKKLNIDEIKILHFSLMTYEQWRTKFCSISTVSPHLLKFFHNKSDALINQYNNNEITEDNLKNAYLDLMKCNLNQETLLSENKIFKIELDI